MTDPLFVDSNILLYRHDADQPQKQAHAQALLAALWKSRRGRVSTQVLSEFYAVATRKLGVTRDAARREIRQLHSWKPTPPTTELYERAWEVEDRFGLSWWDALIVAAAQQARCQYLLTEDLQDAQNLGGLLVANPFRRALADLDLA
jgi:predicted nucleic acid-binding protein